MDCAPQVHKWYANVHFVRLPSSERPRIGPIVSFILLACRIEVFQHVLERGRDLLTFRHWRAGARACMKRSIRFDTPFRHPVLAFRFG